MFISQRSCLVLHVLERYSVDRVAQQQQTIAFSFVMDRGPTEREREGAREPTAPFVIMNWSQFDAAAAAALSARVVESHSESAVRRPPRGLFSSQK